MYKDNITWQEQMFYDMPVVSALTQLTFLQNVVLNAEFKTYSTIYKNLK